MALPCRPCHLREIRCLQKFSCCYSALMNATENLKSRFIRYAFNLAPVFRATGAWLTHISADMRVVQLKLPLKLKTKNPMGTMCGGNMYSAVHGIYLVMLLQNLGKEYVCVDRLSTIRFLKPGKGTLFARFELTQAELDEAKRLVDAQGKTDREYTVELKDAQAQVCGEVTCTVHVRKKKPSVH
jgi:acyl-coenzyme A thioesterase PaaI-like protein